MFSNEAKVNWKTKLDVKNSFYAPLFSGKLVIVAGTDARFNEPNVGLVSALDVSEGKTAWKFRPERGIEAPLLVSRGIIYVTNADYFGSLTGGIYALDAATGRKLWRFSGGGVWATPLMVGDTLFFGSDDRNFYAIDSKNGKKRWRFTAPDPLLVRATSAGRTIVFSSSSQTAGTLIAVDRAGKELWRYTTGRRINNPATADGQMIYFGNGDDKKSGAKGTFYCLKAGTGDLVWSFEGNALEAPPVVSGDLVLFSALDRDERIILYALDKSTGQERWRLKNDPGSGVIRPDPLAEGDTIYQAADKLLAIGAGKGKVKWRFDLAGVETFPPVVEDGVIYYVVSQEGGEKAIEKENAADPKLNLYAIEPKTGKPMWRFTRAEEAGDFAVRNGTVYLVTREGRVYSVGGN